MPFKGTGKEYIGDDIPEVREAVKRAIEKRRPRLARGRRRARAV